jgi:hypothetical protein
MNTQNKLHQFTLRKRTILAVGFSAFFGLSAYTGIALALESAPTQQVMGRAPTAIGAVTIQNDTRPGERGAIGDTLSMHYTFYDADGDAEYGSGMEWASEDAGGTHIRVGEGPTYTITAADAGRDIWANYAPETDPAITDPYYGGIASSARMTIGNSNQPTAIQIHNASGLLTGRPMVGEELTAQPICPAACDPTLAFTWSVDGIEAGTGTTYIPSKDDQKKAITISTPTVLK